MPVHERDNSIRHVQPKQRIANLCVREWLSRGSRMAEDFAIQRINEKIQVLDVLRQQVNNPLPQIRLGSYGTHSGYFDFTAFITRPEWAKVPME